MLFLEMRFDTFIIAYHLKNIYNFKINAIDNFHFMLKKLLPCTSISYIKKKVVKFISNIIRMLDILHVNNRLNRENMMCQLNV